MARILVVEDDAHIAEGLQFNLEAEGHEVVVAREGAAALERLRDRGAPPPDEPSRETSEVGHASRPAGPARSELSRGSASRETSEVGHFALVVLDLMLPNVPGLEVLRRIRAAGDYVPVLVLTAMGSPDDRVRGLEEGADDYLAKPFRLEELLARVRGLLRRRRWDGVSPSPPAPVRIGQVVAHFDRLELETPDGVINLTTREAGLLRALVESEGAALTRGELLERVWGLRPDTRTRVVDSFVVRLRRYVEPDPARPRHIVSVRGHGYRLIR